MKPAGLLFSVFALVSPAPAAGPATASASPLSRDISAKIRAGLPSYRPPAPKSEGDDADSARAPDPDVLVLPKMTVEEKRLPRDAADHLMSREDFKRKMENLYLDEIAKDGPLNYFLNRFTIPILSPSKAERGKALYRQRELERLRQVMDIGGPDSRQQLERELDNSHTTRPAGGLPKK